MDLREPLGATMFISNPRGRRLEQGQELSSKVSEHLSCQLSEDGRLTASLIPRIPNAIRTVQDNMKYYEEGNATERDVPRNAETMALDKAVSEGLHSLFHLCGSGDIWPYVLSGELAVSGSILLMMMEHFPNRLANLKFNDSDIDLYMNAPYPSVGAKDYINMGFVDAGENDYGYQVLERKTSPMDGFEGRVPHKVQIVMAYVEESANKYDYRFLSNYFTQDSLTVMYPAIFVTKLPLNFSDRSQGSRSEKYEKRGYKTNMNLNTSDLGHNWQWYPVVSAYCRREIRKNAIPSHDLMWEFDEYCSLQATPASKLNDDATALQTLDIKDLDE